METPWMDYVEAERGQKGITGKENNPRINEYLKTVGLSDDETPWCSAFANWCMEQAGLKGTGRGNARSWLDWGMKTANPEYGTVVVMKRGKSSWQGHVTFFIKWDGDKIVCLGGNQSNSVKESTYSTNALLGYRNPE